MEGTTYIAHVGLTVSDMESAIGFFTTHFGFVVEDRQLQDNPYTRATVGVADAVVDNVILALTGDQPMRLQLLRYRVPQTTGAFLPVHSPGAVHLALAVEDIWRTYERCCTHGVQFTSPPNRIDSGRNAGGLITYAVGPDNLRVELVQPAPMMMREF